MERNTNLILFIFCFFCLGFLPSCKHDNQFKTQLASSTLIKPFAKYLKLGSNYTTLASGSSPAVIRSGQTFDSSHWGWSDATAYLSDATTLVVHHNFTQPLPTVLYQADFLIPFGDGTWPTNYVSTGVIRSKAITGYSYATYATNGTATTPTKPNTYTVQYDAQTGLVNSAVSTVYDATGNVATKTVYKFALDPRAYSSYYNAGFSLYTGVAEALSGSTVSSIGVSVTGSNSLETYTDKNYNAAGVLADLPSNSFGMKNGSTVVKKVRTVGVYGTAITGVLANSIQKITTYYSSDTNAVFKEVTTTTYNNLTNRLPQSLTVASYTIAAGAETLASQTVTTFSSGFESIKVESTVTAGVASVKSTTTTTRNGQGHPTQVAQKNSSSVLYYQVDYTYDSSGRLVSYRPQDVAAKGATTCAAGAYDMAYNTTTSVSGAVIYVVSHIDYPCVSTVLSTNPSGKITTTYNTSFLALLVQTYTYLSGTFNLTAQSGHSYNSAGQQTRSQDYSLSQSIATASTYTNYTYDLNGFLVSSIPYTTVAAVSAGYTVYSYSYK